MASSWNALTAYIYDIAPEEERGAHLSVYNMFIGIVFLSGSLVAGVLGDVIGVFMEEYAVAFTMLVASGVLRFVSSLTPLYNGHAAPFLIRASTSRASGIRIQLLGRTERICSQGETRLSVGLLGNGKYLVSLCTA
jgi:MFS family permease